ncbi:hypothetical protein MNV49_007307 [Pseudohyphozyma bogoriensis]|nr:hypothetical protein MNV49_007307 [Pseudohyphozyma bogoriensis]
MIKILLSLSFSSRCNFACGFCFHTAKTGGHLPKYKALRGLKLLKEAGMKKVNFAGGEPFLYDKLLGDMAKYCKEELGLKVTVITNGSRTREKWLSEYGRYFDMIGVSCDSFDEDTNIKIGRSERQKVFQVLPLEGENTGTGALRTFDRFKVTDEKFQAFLDRHAPQKAAGRLVPESNDLMKDSYLILDEEMRFLDCSKGGKTPGRSLLDVGVRKALTDVEVDGGKFLVKVTNVASGVDATTGANPVAAAWNCPAVTDNAPIYFYQFYNVGGNDNTTQWTTRFTIAGADGYNTTAANAMQPDGSPIPWGVGALQTDDSTSTSTTSAATPTTTFADTETSIPSTIVNNPALNTTSYSQNTTILPSSMGVTTNQTCEFSVGEIDWVGKSGAEMIREQYNFTDESMSRILNDGSSWNGDASTLDWIVDMVGYNASSMIEDGTLALSLTQDGGGTRISSTRSILYGNVSASIKTVGVSGVVTAFITMSGAKDEIDWEFTTNDTSVGQSNYFWLGDVGTFSAGGTEATPDRDAVFHD